jgi:glucokinase
MNTEHFPHPLIVADIGGTNARFALAISPGDSLRLVAKVGTASCQTPQIAILEAIAACGPARPQSIIICAAGPVLGRHARLTNAPWVFEGPQIAAECRLAQGLLLNDFEAAALSLAFATPADLAPIGPAIVPGRGPKVILGPGTGLGVAALIECGGTVMALPGEGGHVGIGPQDAEDEAFWPHIERIAGRVTSETLLCGPGLVRLHKALAPQFSRDVVEDEPPVIAANAIAGSCSHCVATVGVFLKHLARFAGDMGIVYGATGGVYIRGGVLTSLAPMIDPMLFRGYFNDKQPVDELARAIPLSQVPDDAIILRALAGIGAEPRRFAIDYASRLWV